MHLYGQEEMLEYDFRKSIGYWVGSMARALERAVNEELSPHGITIRQVQILACLALRKQLSQIELADIVGIEPSTLVRTLDRMERDGWVERLPAPDDRRKKIIRATAKVKPIWSTIAECGERVKDKATRGIKKSDLQATQKILEKMIGNFGVDT